MSAAPSGGSVASAISTVRGLAVSLRRPGQRDLPLVDGVALDLHAGAVLGVVGETGAGKTLTMRSMLGLTAPSLAVRGELTLPAAAAIDLADRPAVRALLGDELAVVLQNPIGMFDPVFRVEDQLLEGVCRRGLMTEAEARERAEGLLAAMGFRDGQAVMRLYPHELSGGMAQRVATAMAMMSRPRVMVLDEPTSALDANVRVEVLRLVRRLAEEEEIAMCLVSHDLGLVSHFAASVAVMYAGRVLETGPTLEVLRAPAQPYTKALIASSPSLEAARRRLLRVIEGAPPAPGALPPGCVFEPRCPRATDRCRAERPALEPIGPGLAACHYAAEVKESRDVGI